LHEAAIGGGAGVRRLGQFVVDAAAGSSDSRSFLAGYGSVGWLAD